MSGQWHRAVLIASVLAPFAVAPALAGPNGPSVVAGSVTVQGQGTPNVVVNQSSQNAIVNWQTFNIGNGETVNILMPGASSTELDRVTGGFGPSQILGSLFSNGRVFLVNPDGILFGAGARINVGGLLATTSNISNSDFMAGRYNFGIPGNPSASIVNQGTITAQSGGFAALVAPGVRNTGTITAWLGRVGLTSADTFALDLYGDRLIQLNVNDSIASQVIDVSTGQPLKSLVSNAGKIKANGGTVQLTAVAARQIVDSVINNTGVIEANTIGTHNGMIVLEAATAANKPAGAPTQTVKVSGTLSAAGKKKGTSGGTIEATGENIQVAGADINASGQAGGGAVLIGGDWGGGNPNTSLVSNASAYLESYAVPTASSVSIDAATMIDASATTTGNGGKVIVWSNGATAFDGTILAQGGAQAGNGGFVETSGEQLAFNGTVNTSAPAGRTGTWLLDPTNLTVDSSAAATIDRDLATTNVTLVTNGNGTTSGPGTTSSGPGDIIVDAAISWSSANTLALDAYNAIIVNAKINVMGAGKLVLDAASNPLAPAAPLISFGSGGSVQFTDTPGSGQSLTINGQAYTLLYSMSEVQNINATNANLAGHYALALPLDASGVTSWTPIGTDGADTILNSGNGFNGTFQGLGNTISNLSINLPSSNFVGLFGWVGTGGLIQNFGSVGGSVTGGLGDVGALVGINLGTVSQSYASAAVNVSIGGANTNGFPGVSAGGLVGASEGLIINSYASGAVNVSLMVTNTISFVDADAGGLVGYSGGLINSSYATSAVNVTLAAANTNPNGESLSYFVNAGGLVGSDYSSEITNSYATGAVNLAAANANLNGNYFSYSVNAGGLVGSDYSSSIANSYATGAVNVSIGGTNTNTFVDTDAGGLVGYNYGSSIANSYATGAVSVILTGTNTNMSDYYYDNYAYAGGLVGANFGGAISQSHATGAVTVGANATAGGLVGINDNCCDINGKPIAGASIANSYATGAVSSAGIDVELGGLVGQNDPLSLITNSQAYGAVTSTANLSPDNNNCSTNCQYVNVGGFVGSNYGTITGTAWTTAPTLPVSCGSSYTCAAGNVSVGSLGQGGGFVGENDGIISYAFATGNVTGAAGLPDTAGQGPFNNTTQIAGFVADNEGEIANSFATGAVGTAGTQWLSAAGFAGSNEGTIANSFATGAVNTGDNSTAGGFVGGNSPNNSFTTSICSIFFFCGDGYNNNAAISNSQAYGNVTVGASSVAGGFASNAGNTNGVSGGSFINVSAFGAVNAGHDSIVGGLVGALLTDATISNSAAHNTLVASSGPDSIIGGIAGVSFGTISNSTSTAPVSGTSDSYIGGIVGINLGLVANSAADPTVSGSGGNNFIGGIAGLNVGSIENSTANVTLASGAPSYVGGVVGVNGSYSNVPGGLIPNSSFPTGTIVNSSATGSGFSNPVGATVPTSAPAVPSWLSSCTDAVCTILTGGSLQPTTVNGIPPIDYFPTQQTTQFTQNVNFGTTTTTPPLINPVDLTSATSGPGVTGGPGNGTGGNGGNGTGSLATGRRGGNGAPPGMRLIDMRIIPLPPGSGLPPPGETRFSSNDVVLQFASGMTQQQIAAIAQRFGLTVEAQQSVGMLGRTVYTFRIGNGQTVREVIRLVEAAGVRAAAQPNYTYGLTQDQNAPGAPTADAGDPAQYIVKKLDLVAAQRISKGDNIVIAVIDSEIDTKQPDFAGSVVDRFDAGCGAAAPDAHGTGMAGAIGSRAQLLGVAPNAKIIAICAFGGAGTPEATSLKIIRGLDYAIQHGAKIVNMSFAGPYDPALAQALQVAREKGILIVAAAGNNGPKAQPLYPGADPNVMAVTATDENDRLFSGANQGKYIAIAAPGVDILVPAPDAGVQFTTGTSVATANVSGIAALLLAEKPSLAPEDVRAILVSTAKHLGSKGINPQFGAGLVDPLKALHASPAAVGHKSADASPPVHIH